MRHMQYAVVILAALLVGCGTDKSAFAAGNQGGSKPSLEFKRASIDHIKGDPTALQRMKQSAQTFEERKHVFLTDPTVETAKAFAELANQDNSVEIARAWWEAKLSKRFKRGGLDREVSVAIHRKLLEIAEAANTVDTWTAAGMVAQSLGGDADAYASKRYELAGGR